MSVYTFIPEDEVCDLRLFLTECDSYGSCRVVGKNVNQEVASKPLIDFLNITSKNSIYSEIVFPLLDNDTGDNNSFHGINNGCNEESGNVSVTPSINQ